MRSSPIYDDQELLHRVAMGDERAFELIYHKYTKKIYLFALKTLHATLLAEEVVQETMLKIWRMGPKLLEINNVEAYLRITARNICLNMLRRQEIESRASHILGLSWDEENNDTEELVILNDTRKVIDQAVALLPPQQREVYQLCHVKGLKYEEVAEKLHLSPATVATHMKLALRFLRNHLQKNVYSGVLLLIFKLL